MKLLQLLKSLIIIFFLTVLTQTGGVIYLIYKSFSFFLNRKFPKKYNRFSIRLLAFCFLYIILNTLITPVLAKKSGRVPLPIFANNQSPIAPAKWYTVIMNRHYATPEMASVAIDVARQINTKFEGTTLSYLDANFPFIDGFPLLPHLSHDDGKKLDLTFFYKNGDRKLKGNPGLIGYGFCEAPKSNELNTVRNCISKGHWQYNILSKLNVGIGQRKYQLDESRTKFMIQKFSSHSNIKKLFLEPHLKSRFGLSTNPKIRFQGCHSVRHDDHLHIQL